MRFSTSFSCARQRPTSEARASLPLHQCGGSWSAPGLVETCTGPCGDVDTAAGWRFQ